MGTSPRWKTRRAILDEKTCIICRNNHGKIYELGEKVFPSPPVHWYCRCTIRRLKSILAGTATQKGRDGADWQLKYNGKLPDYYITPKVAKKNGWNPKEGNLNDVLPGNLICGGIYLNKNGHLPSAPGRIWYEADINYTGGWRGMARLLYSSDGLIFVTHYIY